MLGTGPVGGHDASYEGTVPTTSMSASSRLSTVSPMNTMSSSRRVERASVTRDYVIRALDELGDVKFHRVRIRPGNRSQWRISPIMMPLRLPFLANRSALTRSQRSLCGRSLLVRGQSRQSKRRSHVTSILDPKGSRRRSRPLKEDGDGRRAMPLGHADSPLFVYDDKFDPSVLSSSTRASRADGVVITQSPLVSGETVSVVPYSVIE